MPTSSSARSQSPVRPKPIRTRITNDLRQQVIARYQTGTVSAQACANEFTIAKATVLRILREAGVPIRPQGKRLT